MSDRTANQQENFSLGLTYWPRRTGFGWWQAFDRAETREELSHVASLGCDTVRFCLRWEDFQPSPRRVNSGAMGALEQSLDAAQEAGLRVVAVLFPVAIGGALQLPEWANRPDLLEDLRQVTRFGPALVVPAAGQPPVMYEGGYHNNQARDLFSDPGQLDAQRYLIREVVGYFAGHPALWAWQLGEGLERVHKPGSAEAVQEWFASMIEVLRERHANARVLGVTSARGLAWRPGPRPEHLAATCDLVGVAADPPSLPRAQHPLHTAYVAYIQALTSALSRVPVIITSLGLPTAPNNVGGWISDNAYGRSIRAYRAETEQQTAFMEIALDQLQRAGARGAWLASYADYPQPLWRMPPLDRSVRERTQGLVDADGREKPAAAALRAFAQTRRSVAEVAPPVEADPEYYWRDPERSFAELWREFSSEQA